MIDNYEHYITRNIRAFYKRRLLPPICYLLLLFVLYLVFPLGNILAPLQMTEAKALTDAYHNGNEYITITFDDLTFTGYTTTRFGSTNGYWYYGTSKEKCFIVLLTPLTCEEGLPLIDSLTTTCKVAHGRESYEDVLEYLAADLEWTSEGITNQLPDFYFSEPDCNPFTNIILFLAYFGTLLYALVSFIRSLLFIRFPFLAPAVQNLVVFGNPKKQLEEAEEELATLPQLATEDMFITEHYFIMTSPYGNAIVPIQEILWIYKYSTLNKVLWYHFSISYTLHITANKHLFIHCPKNIKSDIDGIMDYLAEANHDILVGFTEANRRKVQGKQVKPFQIEKWTALLNKRV